MELGVTRRGLQKLRLRLIADHNVLEPKCRVAMAPSQMIALSHSPLIRTAATSISSFHQCPASHPHHLVTKPYRYCGSQTGHLCQWVFMALG